MSFADKVVIVTGASSGIGAAIAVKFCEGGARVTLVGRNQDKLNAVMDKCQKTSGKPHAIIADVTNESDAQRIVDETLKRFEKLDILINNAGVACNTSIFDDNIMQSFEKIMSTNLGSVVQITHLCAKHLIETKGNIVNISSVASMLVSARGILYYTSKAGVDHFTRCVALELAPKGVRVNTVNPGPVNTDLVDNMGLTEAQQAKLWNNLKYATALDRIADPEEIADLVLFVASDKARSITGASLLADNGMLLPNSRRQN